MRYFFCGRLWLISALFSILVCGIPAVRADSSSQEYQVKAAFLYNFAKFVDWPAESFRDDLAPISCCILGEDPFGAALDSIKNKTVKGRKLIVKRCRQIEEAVGCHILFISASERGKMKALLKALKSSSVLTVSETERFAQQGGMINFIAVENKIHFEINPEAVQQVKLKISSQLLKLAKITSTED